jgi:peptide/nickel transport system permease protein
VAAKFSPRLVGSFGDGTLRLLRHPLMRRLAQALLVAFLLMVFAFLLIRLIPGDPAMILLGDSATEEDVIAYRKLLGIDGSIPSQFGRYVSNLARGDFGISIRSREPILSIVQKRLPVSLWLTATTIFMTVVLALPLGVAAALYRRTWFGHAFQIGASVLVATPVFFSGLLLILLFAVQVNLAPIAGYHAGFPANLYYLWLPALTINFVLVPVLARILQSSIVETAAEEFVEAAVIRGTQGWRFYWRYLLRPSLAPTIAALGYFAATVVSYAVIIEIIFNLPGIGMTLVDAVRNRDYPLVQGIVFLSGLLVVGLTFFADLVNGWLDPRVKIR